jgi:dihydropyrimidinase
MAELDLVIANGTIVTAAESRRADVGIKDGRIVALGERLEAPRVIDASQKLVLPGGVDGHCHIAQRSSMGIMTADDFYTGGVSAACGGTTTFIPFAAQHRGQSLSQVVADHHRRAQGRAFIDYAFHLIVSDPTERVLEEELPELIRQGLRSFKIYLTYDALRVSDRQALEVLAVARREGALTLVHAENHDTVAWLTESLLRAGSTAPRFHAQARPPVVEREATHRAISLAEAVGAPLLIVHVSSREALEQIEWAQGRGLPVYGETCPQYLVLTAADLDRPGFEGAKYMCSPPPRGTADQAALWDALRRGVLQIFSSDHSPYRFDDPQGKKLAGDDAPFNRIPNGVPGLEVRLPILFSEGVGKGRIDLQRFVALTATNPARIFGLYPQKGTIAVGSDADLALWDPEEEVTISQSRLHDNMDYTPFEGMRLKGWPAVTLSRGEVVCERGEVRGEPGRGRYLGNRSAARGGLA